MKSHVRSWNKVVSLLIALEKAWDKHREVALQRPELSSLDQDAQRMLTLPLNKYAFEHAIQEFPMLWKGKGGPANLLLALDEEETKTTTTSGKKEK